MEGKMNILVFGLSENLGGIESFLYNYVSRLESEHLHFDFLCNEKEAAYRQELSELGCNFYWITARSHSISRFYKELENFFRRRAGWYDAIWVNVCSLANIDYLKMAKKYGIAVRIVHSHNSQNMDGTLRGVLHRLNRNRIGKFATHFWACSDVAGQWFYSKEIRASSKYRLVKNAIDAKRFLFSQEDRERIRNKLHWEGKVIIGHVGRLHFQKNQSFLLDIFYETQKELTHAFLVLIGQGPDREMLESKAKQLGIRDKVAFLGMQTDIKGFLSAMDVFVFPSVFEGLSIVAIEAQASGLPVLASPSVLPDDARLTPNFQFVSLEKTAKEWSEKVIEVTQAIENGQAVRIKAEKEVREKGFDIGSEALKLEQCFLGLGKRK